MKLSPLGDRVVLKQLEAEETTKVRNYISKQQLRKNHRKQKLSLLVLERDRRWKRQFLWKLTVGQTVIYSKYAGTEVKLDGDRVYHRKTVMTF